MEAKLQQGRWHKGRHWDPLCPHTHTHTAPTMKERDHVFFFWFVLFWAVVSKWRKGETDFVPVLVNKEKEGQAKIITDTKPSMDGSGPCLFFYFSASRRIEVKVHTRVSCQAPIESTSWALTQQNAFWIEWINESLLLGTQFGPRYLSYLYFGAASNKADVALDHFLLWFQWLLIPKMHVCLLLPTCSDNQIAKSRTSRSET